MLDDFVQFVSTPEGLIFFVLCVILGVLLGGSR